MSTNQTTEQPASDAFLTNQKCYACVTNRDGVYGMISMCIVTFMVGFTVGAAVYGSVGRRHG